MNRIEAGVEEANSVAAEALEIANDAKSATSNLNDTCSKLVEKTSDLKNRTDGIEQTVTSNKNEIDSSLLIANKSIGSISEKIESITSKLNTKQDSLKAGVNLKTINNESLLGTGNIAVVTDTELPYTELDSVDLNTLSVQGVYKLTNAINTPDDTATSGTLHVNRLSDNGYEQL